MTQKSDDIKALWDAVIAKPEDDAARMGYADILEQSGIQSNTDLARFIRTQLQLARRTDMNGHPLNKQQLSYLYDQEEELLRQHRAEWEQPLRALGVTFVHFHKGLPNHIVIDYQQFLEHAQQVMKIAPIGYVDFYNNNLGTSGVRSLANTPQTERLISLCLRRNSIDDEGAQIIADSQYFRRLSSLDLKKNNISEVGLRALANSTHLSPEMELDTDYFEGNIAELRKHVALGQPMGKTDVNNRER